MSDMTLAESMKLEVAEIQSVKSALQKAKVQITEYYSLNPWWFELSEYPSPLDVKRLRNDATALLGALKGLAWNERGHFSEVCASLVNPGECPDFCVLAREAIAQAERS